MSEDLQKQAQALFDKLEAMNNEINELMKERAKVRTELRAVTSKLVTLQLKEKP